MGQIESNALGLPKLWVSNCKVELKDKGSYDWVMIPNVALLGWKDTKLNFMLSTVPSLANKRLKKPFETKVIIREGGTEKDRRSHTPAKLYNEEMGGVDLNGSHRARISSKIQSHKWWHPSFLLLSISVW